MLIEFIKNDLGEPEDNKKTTRGQTYYWYLKPNVRLAYVKNKYSCSIQEKDELGAFTNRAKLNFDLTNLSKNNSPLREDYLKIWKIAQEQREEYIKNVEEYLDVIEKTWPSPYWEIWDNHKRNKPSYEYVPYDKWDFKGMCMDGVFIPFKSPLLKFKIEINTKEGEVATYATVHTTTYGFDAAKLNPKELKTELMSVKKEFVHDLKATHKDLARILGVQK